MTNAEKAYLGDSHPRVIDHEDGSHTPKTIIGTAIDKFRDPFTSIDTTKWDLVTGTGDLIRILGNVGGASYLSIIKSIFNADQETSYTSKKTFTFPARIAAGLSLSQRILGQEHGFEIVGVDANDITEVQATPAPIAISGSITVATNVWTIDLISAHGLQVLDRIVIAGCADPRLNVGPITVTGINSPTQITVTSTLANATYTATGGTVRKADPIGLAIDGTSYLFDGVSATQANYATRDNTGASYGVTAIAPSTTTATQVSTGNYSESFIPASIYEHLCSMDSIGHRSFAADSSGALTHYAKRSQQVPDIAKSYKIRFRSKNLINLTVPGAKITAIGKTGTTTATVTTGTPHGLTVNDWVQIYGVRDITNFPNLTAQTQVASVIDANNFTIIIGGAVTASSAGGCIARVQGSTLLPGALNFSIQSVQVASGELTVTLNTTAAGALVGEWFTLYGLDSTGAPYEGTYKVIRVTGSTIVFATTAANAGPFTCGGVVVKNTEYRLHFARMFDFKRVTAEIYGGTRQTDQNNAVSVTVENSLSASSTQSTGINTTQWSAAGWGGFLVNDVVSAALTTTTTTAAITPGVVANLGTYAHSFNCVVTAVTGTTPTLDLSVEESDDNGTNWRAIYMFPRITANGVYQSPAIRAQAGTRYRYVQTVAGTTPSFTRAINRIQLSHNGQMFRQFIDRTIVPGTLNSVTPTYNAEGCRIIQLTVNLTAWTSAPTFVIEGSEDGTNFYTIGNPLSPGAVGTFQVSAVDVIPKFIRARVSVLGTATLGFLTLKGLCD